MEQFLAVLLTAVVAGLGKLLNGWIATRTASDRTSETLVLSRVAVAAAEEVGKKLDLSSADKLRYAKDALGKAGRRLGMRLTDEELDAFIHAVVGEAHQLEETLLNLPTPEQVEGGATTAAA
jgi:hypothetical protein